MRARRSIKRSQLTLRHHHARFDWSHDHLGWTIRTWRQVHWSDESRFLLRPTDGRARVWRQRNTSFQDNHILGTTAFGGGKISRECNDIIGSAKGSQISETYWGELGKGKRADAYLEVRKRRGHTFFEWNKCLWTCLCFHIQHIYQYWQYSILFLLEKAQ